LEEGFALLAGGPAADAGRDRETPAWGTLEYEPNRTLRLPLLGASTRVFDSVSDGYPVHGFTDQGTPCSLLDCLTGRTSVNTARGFSSAEITGHALVVGAHVDSIDEPVFDRVELSLTGLREFLAEPLPTRSGESATLIADGAERKEIEIELPGATLTFVIGEVSLRAPHQLTLERQAIVSIELTEPASYSDWEDRWVQPLLSLLRLATREPVTVESFKAIHVDGTRREVEFIRPYADLLYAGPRYGFRRMLLSAGAVEEQLPEVLARWWELTEQLGRAGHLLFAMLNSRGYADAQLVTLASVAEAYSRTVADAPPLTEERHEQLIERMLAELDEEEQRIYGGALRFANGYPLRERLRMLIERAAGVVEEFSIKGGRLANRIADTRNDLVHLPAEQDELPLSDRELVEASELLVLALQANLLLDIGIDPEHARRLVAESYGQQTLWTRLRRRGHAWPKGA
jgi:hypothetical protein